MNPAFSVIFFTVFSGAGYGVLALFGLLAALHLVPFDKGLGLTGLGLGFAAVSAGLLSSTAHLGRPERAWRAFSQWRSSWLSREGVAAVATYGPVILLAYCWVYRSGDAMTLELWGVLTAIGAALTVACTGKIYQSLKTIPQWHTGWTAPGYLVLGLAAGALWSQVVLLAFGADNRLVGTIALAVLLAGWGLKRAYWKAIDEAPASSSAETATGLGRVGSVTPFEAPHTSDNYLLKEMGYRVARKHAVQLRRYTEGLAFALPLGLGILALAAEGWIGLAAALLAAVSVTAGQLIERWLFFAEARHVVTLFYGR